MPDWTGAGAGSLFSTINPFPLGANVTYESVRNADLGTLGNTLSSLDELVSKLATLDDDARNMERMAWASEWRGENAGVTKPVVERAANKFIAAHEQAQSLHNILQSFWSDLYECQEALERYEQNAEHWGAHLSPDGTIRSAEPPHITLTQARTVDLMPFGESVPPETLESMNVLAHEIARVIETAAESDRVAARELSTLMSRSEGQFSAPRSPTMRDAADAQALEDARAVVDLGSKEDKTTADWRRMGEHFGLHADDPLFAQYVIDSLGMDAYLALGQELDYAATELASANVDIESIRTGMGNTFVTAMQPPGTMETHPPGSPAYNAWIQETSEGRAYQRRLDALNAIGTDVPYHPTPFSPDRRTGYDIALDLLEAADLPVDDQFFYQLTSDLIDLELEHPGAWDRERYSDGTPRDIRNDAVDRLLGIGAQNNPEAVAAFFDPEGNGTGKDHVGNSHLDYFIGEGDNARRPPRVALEYVTAFDFSPGSPGLAAALETAATGLSLGSQPGAEYTGHSAANARIAEQIWNTFAADPSRVAAESAFNYLAPTLGHIGAEYISDVHLGINGVDTAYGTSPRPDFTDTGTEHLVRELAKNVQANAAMTAANQAYLQISIDEIVTSGDRSISDMRADISDLSYPSGFLSGALADARATDIYESQISSDESRNAVVDTVNTWTDRALNVAIYETLGSDFPGLASLADAVKGDVTEWTFGLLKVDNSDSAEADAIAEIDSSLTEHQDVGEAAVMAAIERSEVDFTPRDGQSLVNSSRSQIDAGYRVSYADPSPRTDK
ncbi:hypothetical protein [Streptomyces xiamenensis]|uniref:hypothetical protein n=2 Tax=Streptomyces xiamenensis TaxID=408015 RepID=UPI003D74B52A